MYLGQNHARGNVGSAESCQREHRQCESMLEGTETVQKYVGGDIDL
jgi:hypothetical protein